MALFWYCAYTFFMCLAIRLHSKWLDVNNWLILLWFMGFDVITGISKAYILWNAWVKQTYSDGSIQNSRFQSHKLKIGIISKFLVACLPFGVLFFAQVTGGYNVNLPSDIIIAVLCAAEFISSIQNIIVVRTGKETQEVDAITYALRGILKMFRNFIDNNLSKDQP